MRFLKIMPAMLLVSVLGSGAVCAAQPAPALTATGVVTPTAPLRPRMYRHPPAKTIRYPWMSAERIVVKFAEGSEVRLRNGRLTGPAGQAMGAVNRLLARAGISGSAIQRLIDRPEAMLDQEKVLGETRSGKQLADLNLYYLLDLRPSQDIAEVCDDLNKLDVVEAAFPQALPAPSPANSPGTLDFAYLQGYKNLPAGGIGVDAVASVPGVDGQGIKIADIEYDWVLDHEDLLLPAATNTDPETIDNPFPPANHGTAVLGMLVGKANGFGITGIVPAATPLVFPTTTVRFKYNPGRAINRAAAALQPGDVMVLEMQTWVCGTGDYGPAEWSPVVYAVVSNATALGIVVVAAAGNGNVDLDQPACDGMFDRSVRDSGAIIVGAGEAATNNKTAFSSYGSRVDLQGWGDWNVTTAGYGDLYNPAPGDLRRAYTRSFSGTSSATPVVAGAAVAVQGALRASADGLLDSFAMRELLKQTGTPQGTGPHIGPLPNVPAALARLYQWYSIDVVPDDDTNYIDTTGAAESVRVAVLATSVAAGDLSDFNISQLDFSSLRFGPDGAVPVDQINYIDVDLDGDADAELQFSIGETGISCADETATLTGLTQTGVAMQATELIATPACVNAGCHP